MRVAPSDETETEVLVASRRRCALCFGLFGDLDQKRGQLAHVDRNPSNSVRDNLCYLCLAHHDEYDSRTSQSKRFTPSELLRYRDSLYAYIASGKPLTEGASAKRSEDQPFFTLEKNTISASGLDLRLRNNGAPVTCLDFHSPGAPAHVRDWRPRSLPTGEALVAAVDLTDSDRATCVFLMRVRDRSGTERIYKIEVDFKQSPVGFDFVEIA